MKGYYVPIWDLSVSHAQIRELRWMLVHSPTLSFSALVVHSLWGWEVLVRATWVCNRIYVCVVCTIMRYASEAYLSSEGEFEKGALPVL
jgi:hypothetical protein